MYEQHFGLTKRPFRSNAIGTDVFVGPHIAAAMAGLDGTLIANDAIITITGPVGSGKTTLVNRALESSNNRQKIVLVTRMRLDSNDVLELLLDELGVEERPNGTIQKFALFRRHLKTLAENGGRVFVVVEDGVRLGTDTLAEVEALTAADAGESDGASIVLMGDEALNEMLREAPLVRVQQRIRKRLTIAPLPIAELRGYLRHCFRLAGREFEQVFESNAAELLHHLSDGIPRVVNNVIESAMTTAADQDLELVTSTLLARVAENEFGLSAADFCLETQAEVTPDIEPERTFDSSIRELPLEKSVSEPETVPDPDPVLPPVPEPKVEEAVLVVAEPCEDALQETQAEEKIPEFIQDTLPELAILTPALATIAKELTIDPEPESEPAGESTVAVHDEPASANESTGNDVPDWDRDPTMAELKPDLAALEQAISFVQADNPLPPVQDTGPSPVPAPDVPELIPEITLDHAISQRTASNLIDEPGEISAAAPDKSPVSTNGTDRTALDMPPKQNKKSDAEIDRIAIELAKAKSIEDVDDKLAETLFGNEIDFVAAQVLANPPAGGPANDEVVVAKGEPAVRGNSAPDLEVTPATPIKLDNTDMDLSAAQRLKTVQALNANLHPSIQKTEVVAEDQPTFAPGAAPESIEDQINISMTQTLKALNVTPPVIGDSNDDERKSSFFSRFKRS